MEIKEKLWDSLAIEDARYYVYSNKGADFWQTGKAQVEYYVLRDRDLPRPFKKKTLLEIGSGIGRMTKYFAKEFKKVYAVDISGEMIKRAPKIKNVRYIKSGCKLPKIKVDVVFSLYTYQHMERSEIEASLKEVKKVLKKDGVAKIQLRNRPTKKGMWCYGHCFTENEARKMYRKLGFKIIRFKENHNMIWLWLKK